MGDVVYLKAQPRAEFEESLAEHISDLLDDTSEGKITAVGIVAIQKDGSFWTSITFDDTPGQIQALYVATSIHRRSLEDKLVEAGINV